MACVVIVIRVRTELARSVPLAKTLRSSARTQPKGARPLSRASVKACNGGGSDFACDGGWPE